MDNDPYQTDPLQGGDDSVADPLLDLVSDASILGHRAGQCVDRLLSLLSDAQAVIGRMQKQAQRLEARVTEGAAGGQRDRHFQLPVLSRNLGESIADLDTLRDALAATAQDADLVLRQQAKCHAGLQRGLVRQPQRSAADEPPEPLTIDRVVMVSVAGEIFALRLNEMLAATQIEMAELTQLYENPGRPFVHAGASYDICYLGSLLSPQMRPQLDASTLPLILANSRGRWYALQVDGLLGQCETLVRAAEPHSRPGVGGIAVLADGRQVSVLDLRTLLDGQEPV